MRRLGCTADVGPRCAATCEGTCRLPPERGRATIVVAEERIDIVARVEERREAAAQRSIAGPS